MGRYMSEIRRLRSNIETNKYAKVFTNDIHVESVNFTRIVIPSN